MLRSWCVLKGALSYFDYCPIPSRIPETVTCGFGRWIPTLKLLHWKLSIRYKHLNLSCNPWNYIILCLYLLIHSHHIEHSHRHSMACDSPGPKIPTDLGVTTPPGVKFNDFVSSGHFIICYGASSFWSTFSIAIWAISPWNPHFGLIFPSTFTDDYLTFSHEISGGFPCFAPPQLRGFPHPKTGHLGHSSMATCALLLARKLRDVGPPVRKTHIGKP